MIGAEETREAAQEAPQIAKEAFGQVGRLQAITPGSQAQFQESNGGLEALPESVYEVGFGTRPAATEVQGPLLRLIGVVSLIDPPEIPSQMSLVKPTPLVQ